jgi:hypothetical protein
VRARIELYRSRKWLEIVLAFAAALYVASVILACPHDVLGFPIDRFTLFPLSIGLGVWLPLLARTRWSALGELRCEGDVLVIAGRLLSRRVPLRRVRGVRVALGERGASLVMQLDDGGVIAAGLDDIEDARRLAGEIRQASEASDDVALLSSELGLAASIVRLVGSVFALGYYLHEVRDLIPGDKAAYGLGALFAGLTLLVIHLIPRWTVHLGRAEVRTLARALREYPPRLRAHIWLHARAQAVTETASPRPRLAEYGEPLAAWFARTRRELSTPEVYRGPAQGIRARLEHAFRCTEVPLRERALALRVLSAGEPGEVRKRIAEVESLPEEEQAWLEAVALAEDDDHALARIARRPPDFVAWPAGSAPAR